MSLLDSLGEHNYDLRDPVVQENDHEVIIDISAGKEQRKRSLLRRDYSKEVYEHWSVINEGKTLFDSQWKCDYCTYTIKHKKPRMISHLEVTHGYNRCKDTFNPMKTKVQGGESKISGVQKRSVHRRINNRDYPSSRAPIARA